MAITAKVEQYHREHAGPYSPNRGLIIVTVRFAHAPKCDHTPMFEFLTSILLACRQCTNDIFAKVRISQYLYISIGLVSRGAATP